jgi:hypothetical protein
VLLSTPQWIKTKTSLTQAYEVAKGALTGETAAPGALRVINASDVSYKLLRVFHAPS